MLEPRAQEAHDLDGAGDGVELGRGDVVGRVVGERLGRRARRDLHEAGGVRRGRGDDVERGVVGREPDRLARDRVVGVELEEGRAVELEHPRAVVAHAHPAARAAARCRRASRSSRGSRPRARASRSRARGGRRRGARGCPCSGRRRMCPGRRRETPSTRAWTPSNGVASRSAPRLGVDDVQVPVLVAARVLEVDRGGGRPAAQRYERMPRSVSDVTGRAPSPSRSPTQTFRTSSTGARWASRRPSGATSGEPRSGFPKRILRGISSATPGTLSGRAVRRRPYTPADGFAPDRHVRLRRRRPHGAARVPGHAAPRGLRLLRRLAPRPLPVRARSRPT